MSGYTVTSVLTVFRFLSTCSIHFVTKMLFVLLIHLLPFACVAGFIKTIVWVTLWDWHEVVIDSIFQDQAFEHL